MTPDSPPGILSQTTFGGIFKSSPFGYFKLVFCVHVVHIGSVV